MLKTRLAFFFPLVLLAGLPNEKTAAAQEPAHISIDAKKIVRTLDARIYGLNLAMWDRHLKDASTAELLRALDTQVLRIPGGSPSDNYDWTKNLGGSKEKPYKWSTSAATFARVIEARGAQACVTVNYGSGTPEMAAAWVAYYNAKPSNKTPLGTDGAGRDWKTAGYWASVRAAAPLATDDGFNFLRVSHPAPYGFRWWEIGNECYGHWEHDEHDPASKVFPGKPHDAETYAQEFKKFREKMLAVDPSIRIGAVIQANEKIDHGWAPTVLATLKSLGVTPQFVIHHHYSQEPGRENDAQLLQSGAKIESDAANIRKMLIDCYGEKNAAAIEMQLTELNSVSFDPGKQTTSLVNALFMADAIGHVACTEYSACIWWDLRNGTVRDKNNDSALYGWRQFGDYGVVANGGAPDTPEGTPLPTFYAAKILTHWARGGDKIVDAKSDSPLLSAHAARLANGSLALLVINKNPTDDIGAEIGLENFPAGSTSAKLFQYGKPNDAKDSPNPDITESSLGEVSASFRHVFPSYSMSVIVLEKP
jgi:hypothetical protein